MTVPAAASVELETGRPRGRDDLSNAPAVLLAKAEAALSEQHRVADAEKATLELREKFALEKLGQAKESLHKAEAQCASLADELKAARSSEAKETTAAVALRLNAERDSAVHAAVAEASAAQLAASEARVAALQAQIETAQGRDARPGTAAAAAAAPPRFRVDDGGAVAFRTSPASEDRSSKAAEAGLLINEIGRVIKADGEVWIQHSNELWLPLAFLEPFEPQGTASDGSGSDAHSQPEPEPTPEPEPEPELEATAGTSAAASGSSTDVAADSRSASVSAMVKKLNSPKAGGSSSAPALRLSGDADAAAGGEAWGDGGSAPLARVAVRASAAECEAQRARADASAKEVERLVATVAELKAALRQSKRTADEADAARQQLSKTVTKLEGESAVHNERAISTRRLMEEEKAHGAVLTKQAARAEERLVEMGHELTDVRMQLSAQQTRAVASAAELLAAEEAASVAEKNMEQKVAEIQRRCDLAVKRGDELLTLQEMAAANAAAQHSAAAAAAPGSSNGSGASAAAVAAAEIKAADQQRVIDALQDELRWHRRQQGRIERAVRICIKRTWRHSLSWWAFAVWKQCGTLSGDEPAYSKSEAVAEIVAEAAAEANVASAELTDKGGVQASSGGGGSGGGGGAAAASRWGMARDAVGLRGPPVRHLGVKCDVSGMFPITGNRYQKLEEDFDLCEAEWLHLPEEEQKNYMLITHPNATPCSPFEADAEAELETLERELKKKADEKKAAVEAAEEKAKIEKEAEAKIQSKQFIAEGYGHLFRASGEERDAAWDKAQKCFERALTWRADAEQAAKGLAELRALRAAAAGNGWDGPDDDDEEEGRAEAQQEEEQPLRANISDYKMQHTDMEGKEVSAFVEYTVAVSGGGVTQPVVARHRFSSFKALHQSLAASLPPADYPETQATQHLFSFSLMTWFDTLDRDFIEQRVHWLRVYLGELVRSPVILQQPQLRSFLRLESGQDRSSGRNGTAGGGGRAAEEEERLVQVGQADSSEEAGARAHGDEQHSRAQQRGRQGEEDAVLAADANLPTGNGRRDEQHQRVSQDEQEQEQQQQKEPEEEDDAEFERRLLEGTEPASLPASSAPPPSASTAAAQRPTQRLNHSELSPRKTYQGTPGQGQGPGGLAAGSALAPPGTPQRRLPANMPSTPRSAVGSAASSSSSSIGGGGGGGGPPELPRTPLRSTIAISAGDMYRSPMRTGNAGMPAPSSVSSNYSPYLGEQRRFLASTPSRSPYQGSSGNGNGNGNGNGSASQGGAGYGSPRALPSSPMRRNFDFDSESDFGAGQLELNRPSRSATRD
jgi:hypothetical protein